MTKIKSILLATFMTLAVSTSAMAGDIHSRTGDIYSYSGDIHSVVTSLIGIII
jgi:hypothetical protein